MMAEFFRHFATVIQKAIAAGVAEGSKQVSQPAMSQPLQKRRKLGKRLELEKNRNQITEKRKRNPTHTSGW